MIYISTNEKKIPAIGYGTWPLLGRECQMGTETAIRCGYRHIDTAQKYDNESEVGNALIASGIKREDIFLTTKIWHDNLSNGELQRSVASSLKKLNVDYVDLLLIHWPITHVSFREQLTALQQVQRDGLATLIGVSNFTSIQMKVIVEGIGANIINNQIEYHPYLSQKQVIDYAKKKDMFVTAYCPLARGRVFEDPTIQSIALRHNKTPGQIALRWLMQQGIAAIPRASSEKHILENIDIFDFELNAGEMDTISSLNVPDSRICNPKFSPRWDV